MADTLLASGDPAVTLQALVDILAGTNAPSARIVERPPRPLQSACGGSRRWSFSFPDHRKPAKSVQEPCGNQTQPRRHETPTGEGQGLVCSGDRFELVRLM